MKRRPRKEARPGKGGLAATGLPFLAPTTASGSVCVCVCVCVFFPIYFGDSPTDQGETCTSLCSIFRGDYTLQRIFLSF